MKKKFVKIANVYLPCNCLHYKKVLIRPKVGNEYYLYVPCGKCYACRKKIASDWAYRLGVESNRSNVYNILLTYSDDNLPKLDGVPVLNRAHTVECMKRLRYYFDRYFHTKCKFFLVGEYSPENKRPHYHAILFTDRKLQDVDKDLVYINEVFEKKCWRHGFANITALRGNESAQKLTSYMVTYMMTSLPSMLTKKLVRPFRSMSQNLGSNFADDYPEVIRNCHKRGKWTYKYKTADGEERERSYPRYYLKKYSTEFEADARAEEYYNTCKDFENYLNETIQYERKQHRKGLRSADGRDYKDRLATLKEREKEFEIESFRNRKILKHNKQTECVSQRSPQ